MWKVLVVDDNMTNRELLVDILKDFAMCDVASNGREGFNAYKTSLEKQEYYDLILLDIAMPGEDGLTLLSTIREIERVSNIRSDERIPIIMVTAFDALFQAAFKEGCDDCVQKPVDSAQLLHKIRLILTKKGK